MTNLKNLVNDVGVVAADATGVGTASTSRYETSYGGDKAIFGFGNDGSDTHVSNLVSNTGVVASDTTGVGTARSKLSALAV